MTLNEATWVVWVFFGLAGLGLGCLIVSALFQIRDELRRLGPLPLRRNPVDPTPVQHDEGWDF